MKRTVRLKNNSEISEKAIEAYLVRKVKAIGGRALKYAGESGFPDRLILMPEGKAYWVELKSSGEKPRKLQQVRIEDLILMGFHVWVCDSKQSVDEILEFIKDEIQAV